MLFRRSCVLTGCMLLALAAAPAAEAAKPPRLTSLRGVPKAVQVGGHFRVRGRVTAHKKTVKVKLALRRSARAIELRTVKLKHAKRRFSVRVTVPGFVRAGRYKLRACVRKSCRSKHLRVRNKPAPGPGPQPNPPGGPAPLAAQHSLRAPLTGENFYFVMPDRFQNGDTANDKGGIDSANRDVTGFDPTAKGYFHGGDLKGLRSKLDYIKGLGTTAIWLTPSFKNRPVQGDPPNRSAGYHGYWVTDFTQIDPHFGTNQDLRTLIQDAHSRGMKVFFDIITNHTADVLSYTEPTPYTYISKDREPYKTAAGTPFDDRDFAGTNTFPAMDPATSFPYTPVNTTGIQKVPAWLNNPALYHNRGDTTFTGEDSQYGDFFGLDDLFTERPEVVDGMIDIYDTWVRDMRIDGFRIDTMKHVNDEFWQKFSPSVLDYAKRQGIAKFFMFGEVADSTRPLTSHYTTHNDVQAVLDFPFQDAARNFASKSQPTDQLRGFFRDDDYYTDADSNAYQLPTFLGNHDMGHIGMFIRDDNPVGTPESELLARDELAHELMYLSRGNPVVYFGDEQGFTGAGNDQAARQDMFASQDPEYDNAGDDADKNDNLGSSATPADDNFDTNHPLYEEVKALAALTKAHPALRNGAQQHRFSSADPGVYAFSRLDRMDATTDVGGDSFYEVTFYARMGDGPWKAIGTDDNAPYRAFHDIWDAKPGARVQYKAVVLDNAGHAAVSAPRTARIAKPAITLEAPNEGQRVRGTVTVRATTVPEHSDYSVRFERSVDGGAFTTIGTDDSSPVYTAFDDTSSLGDGAHVTYRAVLSSASRGTTTSGTKTVTVVQTPVTQAVIHYNRPDGDYVHWGLHLFGDALAPGEATAAWEHATPFEGTDSFGALHEIAIADDTKRVGFIVHGNADTGGSKDTKDPPPSPDRYFNPLATPEIWLRFGDPKIYSCAAADSTCVVPSA